VIVDAPAAGHAISFLMSARGLLDAVRVGPIRKQAQDVVSLLSDPTRCQVMLVTLAEETPVSEVVDTAFAIEDRAGVALGPVVVNGCFTPLPVGVSADPGAIRADAQAANRFVSPREAEDLAHAAAFLEERHALQQAQIQRLNELLPLPRIELPFVFDPDITRRQLDTLADAFAHGIEHL
jgi:anion-transporting  ArsA/GET3 family ATPase